MASYNIKALLQEQENRNSKGTKGGTAGGGDKITYWKPVIGEHEVRFLPYSSQDGKHCPFQEVLYYEKIAQKRLVAPLTFDLPDPVRDVFEEKRKTPAGWKTIAKFLQPRRRYYGVIMVRGEEDKGPQVWEFSEDVYKSIIKILTLKDNLEEDMFSPDVGYDFTVSVSQALETNGKPRVFKSALGTFAVKEFNINAKRKASKLAPKAVDAEKWLKAMPKLDDFFRKQLREPSELIEALENFVASLENGTANVGASNEAGASSPDAATGTNYTASRTKSNGSAEKSAAEAKLKDAFGIDGDE